MSDLELAATDWDEYWRTRLVSSLNEWSFEQAWTLLDLLDDVVAAAREHVSCGQGEKQRETLWCVAHASTGPTDYEGRGVCWFIMFADALRRYAGSTTKHLPCRMVEAVLTVKGEQ